MKKKKGRGRERGREHIQKLKSGRKERVIRVRLIRRDKILKMIWIFNFKKFHPLIGPINIKKHKNKIIFRD